METQEFLSAHQAAIVDAAARAIGRSRMTRYDRAGTVEVRRRLEVLFTQLLEAVAEHDVRPVAIYAQDIGEERFNAGFDISEVQRAFNCLEEAIWACALAELPPAEFAHILGPVSTALGAGKDALARRYVSLATERRAPALDLQAVLDGAAGT